MARKKRIKPTTTKGFAKKQTLTYEFKRTKKNLAGNKVLNIRKEVSKFEKLLQEAPRELKKQYRDKMFDAANRLNQQRDIYNTEANRELLKQLGVTRFDKVELDDEQKDVLKEIDRRLSDYTVGDNLYANFYHKYGFFSRDQESIYAYAELEGLI